MVQVSEARRAEGATEPVLERVQQAIARYGMLDGVNRLGIGLSGGADSFCLLEALLAVSGDVTLIPLHVRQHVAQEPGALARVVADRYGLELMVREADASAVAADQLRRGRAPCRACAPMRAEAFAAAI